MLISKGPRKVTELSTATLSSSPQLPDRRQRLSPTGARADELPSARVCTSQETANYPQPLAAAPHPQGGRAPGITCSLLLFVLVPPPSKTNLLLTQEGSGDG